MKTRNHNLLFLAFLFPYFSCYCNHSAQQIYNLEWRVGTNLIIFLRVYRGKQRRPYWKAEDWAWLFLYDGCYWHVR